MNFTTTLDFLDNPQLSLKTDDGMDIVVNLTTGGEFSHMVLNDATELTDVDYEFEAMDCLHVLINGDYTRLTDIVIEAENYFDENRAEFEQEAAEEEAYNDYLASPEQTGRI